MQKIIRTVDEKKGIIQVTTYDERWYAREIKDKKTGLPSYQYVPSVTWIAGSYPKGVAFYKWLADKGWDEAQAIKSAAGGKGSKVHHGITALLDGQKLPIDAKLPNPDTGEPEEITLEEYECLASFLGWYQAAKPVVKGNELVVWNDKYGYAGTVDLVAEINGETWIIDVKTSQTVWPEYELQVSAYRHALALETEPKLAILQVGYRRNKNAYKFTEIEDKFPLFLAAQAIWQNDHGNEKPSQKDLPLSLSLNDHGK